MDSNLQINRKYTVLVAGNVNLKDYDINKKVEPYVVYKYSDRKEIKESIINIYEKYIENIPKENSFLKEILSFKLQEIQEMTDEEYFEYATKDMKYDKKTGDALSTINPKGKYNLLSEADKENAMPLIGDSFQCKVKDLPIIVKNDEELERLMNQANIDDPVKMYLKDIGTVQLLTSEQEVELAKKILDGDVRAKKELSEGYEKTTNNRMELLAVIKGLEALKEPCRVNLYSDSKYVVDAIEKGWVVKWKQNGWMRNKKERASNVDLWEQLLVMLEKHQVKFIWVKGHADNPWNERCDELARMAIQKGDLKEDENYGKM